MKFFVEFNDQLALNMSLRSSIVHKGLMSQHQA